MKNQRRHLASTLALTITAALLGGILVTACNTGSVLRARTTEINALTAQIESRALKCAPKELALAQSHASFGAYELDKGNFPRAGEHLAVAFTNAQKADVESRAPECQELAVVVQTDRDRDSIIDAEDACPDEPEDFDGDRDEDGCPEDGDLDRDGVFDAKDLCPTEAGPVDNDGCPSRASDKDRDGILDKDDQCPIDPEDVDGFQDEDGCPDLDNDIDTILDAVDGCPNEAEDRDGFQDEDGCPDYDNDGDGILDTVDKCPDEPEDYDGFEDEDGCDDPTTFVFIDVKPGERIDIKDKIYFKTGSAKLAARSYPTLNEIVQVLEGDKTMKLSIEGHTDNVGSDAYNLKLSRKRAASVRQYLVESGVESRRLSSEGYGELKPRYPNTNRANRAKNRRVEFLIKD